MGRLRTSPGTLALSLTWVSGWTRPGARTVAVTVPFRTSPACTAILPPAERFMFARTITRRRTTPATIRMTRVRPFMNGSPGLSSALVPLRPGGELEVRLRDPRVRHGLDQPLARVGQVDLRGQEVEVRARTQIVAPFGELVVLFRGGQPFALHVD